MRTVLRNALIVTPLSVKRGEVLVSDGKITEIAYDSRIRDGYDDEIDVCGCYLSPGFIDIHTHGGGGYDFMDGTIDDIYGAVDAHMHHGTTSILPTSLTSTPESMMEFIKLFNEAELKREGLAEILGLHLEGPYFSYNERGAQDPRYLRNPLPDEYNRVLSATDRIRRWSFAVELPGSGAFLRVLREHGILASAAHTDADCQCIMDAYDSGVRLLTHFYSGMTGVHRRNAYRIAGAVEAGYLIDDMYVEIIADGSHLPKELLQLILKIKGPDRICLVTDSMRAAGMEDGEYYLGKNGEGVLCIKEDGVAKLPDRSAFAGSVATADMLVRNMIRLAGSSIPDAVRMMTLTPARLLGIDSRKGSVAEGKDADLVIFDDDINIKKVMVRGTLI